MDEKKINKIRRCEEGLAAVGGAFRFRLEACGRRFTDPAYFTTGDCLPRLPRRILPRRRACPMKSLLHLFHRSAANSTGACPMKSFFLYFIRIEIRSADMLET